MQLQKTGNLLFLIRYFDLPELIQQEIKKYAEQFPASLSLGLINQEWNKKNKTSPVIPAFSLKDADVIKKLVVCM
jgi:hypothetical protein